MLLSWRRRPLGLRHWGGHKRFEPAEAEAQRNNASLCVQGSFQARNEDLLQRPRPLTHGWRRWRDAASNLDGRSGARTRV